MSSKFGSGRSVGRRGALRALGGASALVAGAATTLHWKRSFAQSAKTVRVWSQQSSPPQLEAYKLIVADFEKAYPGVKIAIEPVAQKDIWPKLTAALGGGDVPDSIAQIVAATAFSLQDQDALEPMNPVIDAVGRADFEKSALDVYVEKGVNFAVPFANNSLNFWYRKDILEKEGLKVPVYWDEYVQVAKKLTKDGMYGASLPYGKAAMLNTIVWTFIYQAGGLVVGPDGSVVFNSPATIAAVEFLKEMSQYVPPGANRYDWGETLNAFVTGVAATTMYTGRAMLNTHAQNPKIADSIACAHYPYRREGRYWATGTFECLTIPKGTKNKKEAELWSAFCFKPEQYVRFLHSVPGHQLPILKSVAAAPAFTNQDMLQKHKADVATMIEVSNRSNPVGKPTPASPLLLKAGEIQDSQIFAEVVQKVVIGNESAKTAVAWGHDQIGRVMKG